MIASGAPGPNLESVGRSSLSVAGARSLGPRAVTYPYRRIERLDAPGRRAGSLRGHGSRLLRIDWRRHLSSVEVGGTTVNYAEIGEGPPIVFVHGLGGCWQNWLENLPRMAELGNRAIALDLPGFGASPMPSWEITIPGYGELVEDFCTLLELGPCTLVGNSMGGFVAAEVAVNEPEWVERLVTRLLRRDQPRDERRQPVVALSRVLLAANPLRSGWTSPRCAAPAAHAGHRWDGPPSRADAARAPRRDDRAAIGTPGFLPAVGALTGYDCSTASPPSGVRR